MSAARSRKTKDFETSDAIATIKTEKSKNCSEQQSSSFMVVSCAHEGNTELSTYSKNYGYVLHV